MSFRNRNFIILILSIIGFSISSYLAYTYSKELPLFCGLKAGCEAIRLSIYSKFLGLSVPWYGVGGYGALMILSFFRLKRPETKIIRGLIFAGALLGFLFTIYLNYLAFFVIKSYCFWCGISAITMTGIFVISVKELKSFLTPNR